MPEYKIQTVQGPRTWTGKYGEMHSYDVLFDGIEGKVEISQKPTTPAPAAGDSLLGMIQEANGFKKFKKEQAASFGGGGGYKGKSPEEQRCIVRQHSQEMALRYMAVKGVKDFKLDDDFRKVIDWFQNDAGGQG